jgi:hypothetical protein
MGMYQRCRFTCFAEAVSDKCGASFQPGDPRVIPLYKGLQSRDKLMEALVRDRAINDLA